MTEIKKGEKFSPDFLDPTEDEIEENRQRLKDEYGIELAEKDLVRIVSLVKELNWWLNLKNDSASTARIKEEAMAECKEIYRKRYNKEITRSEADESARVLLDTVTENEKKRIGDEMKAIIESNTKN